MENQNGGNFEQGYSMTLLETLADCNLGERELTFRRACELARDRGMTQIVETGCMRSTTTPNPDGCSTLILGQLAREIGARLTSIDIEPAHVAIASEITKGLDVNFAVSDSVYALSARASPIDFLYLDSYDWEEEAYMPCQLHQLAELGAAWGKLTALAIVLLDDCTLPHGGKSGLSRMFLLQRGWKLLTSSYQELWVRP